MLSGLTPPCRTGGSPVGCVLASGSPYRFSLASSDECCGRSASPACFRKVVLSHLSSPSSCLWREPSPAIAPGCSPLSPRSSPNFVTRRAWMMTRARMILRAWMMIRTWMTTRAWMIFLKLQVFWRLSEEVPAAQEPESNTRGS